MKNNQLKRCAKGLHEYREKTLTDLGKNQHVALTCRICNKQITRVKTIIK